MRLWPGFMRLELSRRRAPSADVVSPRRRGTSQRGTSQRGTSQRGTPGRVTSRRGQSLVEFALTAPILLLLLLGTIDVFRIIFAYEVISNAARYGAREASIGQTDAQVQQDVQQNVTSLNNPVTVTITPSDPRYAGETVSVKVQYSVSIIDPLLVVFAGKSYSIENTVSMVME